MPAPIPLHSPWPSAGTEPSQWPASSVPEVYQPSESSTHPYPYTPWAAHDGFPTVEAFGCSHDEAYQPSSPGIQYPGVTALDPLPPQLQTEGAAPALLSTHGLPPLWSHPAGALLAPGHVGTFPAYMCSPTPTPWPGVTALDQLPCLPADMGNPISPCTRSPEASASPSLPQQSLRRVEVIRPSFPHPAAERARH